VGEEKSGDIALFMFWKNIIYSRDLYGETNNNPAVNREFNFDTTTIE